MSTLHTAVRYIINDTYVYFCTEEVRASNVARMFTRQRPGKFEAHEVKDYGWIVKDDAGNYYDIQGKLPEAVAIFVKAR